MHMHVQTTGSDCKLHANSCCRCTCAKQDSTVNTCTAPARMADPCMDIDTDLLGPGVRLGVYLQVIAVIILIGTRAHATLPGHGEAASATLAAILAVLLVRLAQADILATELLLVLFLAGLLGVIATLGTLSADPCSDAMIGSLRLCTCMNIPPPCASATAFAPFNEANWLRRGRRVILNFDPANCWHASEAMRLDVTARRRGRRECGITLQFAVLTTNAAINAWFWQSGYAGLLRGGCGAVWAAFCYVRVPAFGWLRYVMLVLSYALVALYGLVLLMRVYKGVLREEDPAPSLLSRTAAERSVGVDMQWVTVSDECDKLLPTERTKVTMACFVLVLISWVCVGNLSFVEMGMHYNGLKSADVNLAGVGNAVQMLSVLFGAALVLSSLSAPMAPCPMWEAVVTETCDGRGGRVRLTSEEWSVVAMAAKGVADEELERLQTASRGSPRAAVDSTGTTPRLDPADEAV